MLNPIVAVDVLCALQDRLQHQIMGKKFWRKMKQQMQGQRERRAAEYGTAFLLLADVHGLTHVLLQESADQLGLQELAP